VIQNVYQKFFPMVERMVINSGGNNEEAKDVFQEGMIIVFNKLSANNLVLTCSFSTYLYAVCMRHWQQEKRKKTSRLKYTKSGTDMVEEAEPEAYETQNCVKQLFYKHFNQLSKDCQKMLILHFNDVSIAEIQKIMNYQNSHYVMDRKYRCKKSLIQRIKKDPNYKTVQNEYSEQIRSVF